MSVYTIKQDEVQTKGAATVVRASFTKFANLELDMPLELYKQSITVNKEGKLKEFTCTCPSYKQPCKHALILKRWYEMPDNLLNNVYDESTGEFSENPFFGGNLDVEG